MIKQEASPPVNVCTTAPRQRRGPTQTMMAELLDFTLASQSVASGNSSDSSVELANDEMPAHAASPAASLDTWLPPPPPRTQQIALPSAGEAQAAGVHGGGATTSRIGRALPNEDIRVSFRRAAGASAARPINSGAGAAARSTFAPDTIAQLRSMHAVLQSDITMQRTRGGASPSPATSSPSSDSTATAAHSPRQTQLPWQARSLFPRERTPEVAWVRERSRDGIDQASIPPQRSAQLRLTLPPSAPASSQQVEPASPRTPRMSIGPAQLVPGQVVTQTIGVSAAAAVPPADTAERGQRSAAGERDTILRHMLGLRSSRPDVTVVHHSAGESGGSLESGMVGPRPLRSWPHSGAGTPLSMGRDMRDMTSALMPRHI